MTVTWPLVLEDPGPNRTELGPVGPAGEPGLSFGPGTPNEEGQSLEALLYYKEHLNVAETGPGHSGGTHYPGIHVKGRFTVELFQDVNSSNKDAVKYPAGTRAFEVDEYGNVGFGLNGMIIDSIKQGGNMDVPHHFHYRYQSNACFPGALLFVQDVDDNPQIGIGRFVGPFATINEGAPPPYTKMTTQQQLPRTSGDGKLQVQSTAGFPASGRLFTINTAGSIVFIDYTSIFDATHFGGCTNGWGFAGNDRRVEAVHGVGGAPIAKIIGLPGVGTPIDLAMTGIGTDPATVLTGAKLTAYNAGGEPDDGSAWPDIDHGGEAEDDPAYAGMGNLHSQQTSPQTIEAKSNGNTIGRVLFKHRSFGPPKLQDICGPHGTVAPSGVVVGWTGTQTLNQTRGKSIHLDDPGISRPPNKGTLLAIVGGTPNTTIISYDGVGRGTGYGGSLELKHCTISSGSLTINTGDEIYQRVAVAVGDTIDLSSKPEPRPGAGLVGAQDGMAMGRLLWRGSFVPEGRDPFNDRYEDVAKTVATVSCQAVGHWTGLAQGAQMQGATTPDGTVGALDRYTVHDIGLFETMAGLSIGPKKDLLPKNETPGATYTASVFAQGKYSNMPVDLFEIDISGLGGGAETLTTGSSVGGVATVTVANTAGTPAFATSGTFMLNGVPVDYTNKSGTQFTGCTGPGGTAASVPGWNANDLVTARYVKHSIVTPGDDSPATNAVMTLTIGNATGGTFTMTFTAPPLSVKAGLANTSAGIPLEGKAGTMLNYLTSMGTTNPLYGTDGPKLFDGGDLKILKTGNTWTITFGTLPTTSYSRFSLPNAVASTLEAITNGYDGQLITLRAATNLTTIKNTPGGTLDKIRLVGTGDRTLATNDVVMLIYDGGTQTWNEIGQSPGLNSITNALLRDSVAYSVIGRASSGTGDPADIVSATNGVLRRDDDAGGPGVAGLVFTKLVDKNVDGNAAIAYTKLAPMSASMALASTVGGFVSASTLTTATQLGYLGTGGGNVPTTSSVQKQLNDLAARIAAPPLTHNVAVISNNLGVLATLDTVTTTELGYLDGVTAPIEPRLVAAVATQAQLDQLDWKASVRVATVAALPGNSRAGNPSVLTGTTLAPLPAINGVTLALNDRVLVKNETAGSKNGIYYLSQLGETGVSAWKLTRATDASSSAKVTSGLMVHAAEGTVAPGTVWRLTNTDTPPIALDTTSLTFAQLTPSLAASMAVVTDATGQLTVSSTVTAAELGQLDGVSLTQTVQQQFDALSTTVGAHTTAIGTINTHLTTIDTHLGSIDTHLTTVDTHLTTIDGTLVSLQDQISGLETGPPVTSARAALNDLAVGVAPLGGGRMGVIVHPGAAYLVTPRGSTTPVSVYANDSGPTPWPNPQTVDRYGRPSGWVPPGSYDVKVTPAGGTSSYTMHIELPMGSTAPGGGGGGEVVAGAGLIATGTTLDVGAGTGITVNADSVQISASWDGSVGGTNAITKLGTVTQGTWQGTAIAAAYLPTNVSQLAGLTPAANKLAYWNASSVLALAGLEPGPRSMLALTSAAADKVPYFTSVSASAVMTVTSQARDLLDDTSFPAMLTTLGAQAADNQLTALAALVPTGSGTEELPYFTGTGTGGASLLAMHANAKTLLGHDFAGMRADLGLAIGTNIQAYDATLASLAGLGTAADRIAYTTAVDTWAETALASDARTLLGHTFAQMRADLDLEAGTDVQAYDATLASLAGLGTAADKIAYTTAVDTWAETGLHADARTLIGHDFATMRTDLGVETSATTVGRYRHVHESSMEAVAATVTSNVIYINSGSGLLNLQTVAAMRWKFIYIDASALAEAGKTTKLRLTVVPICNAVAPGNTMTVNLYGTGTPSGGAALVNPNVGAGTVVAGSSLAFATGTDVAAASVGAAKTTGDFNCPASGLYVLGILASAAMTANSAVDFVCKLEYRNV